MAGRRFFITDVFTDRRYGGNPLATLVDCAGLSDAEMQSIAAETNFSETTFITSTEAVNGGFDVRIFTPRAEIDFAGHPTLGTAFVIREKLGLAKGDQVLINLRAGQIPVHFSLEPNGKSRLWMRQMPPAFGSTASITDFVPVLGLAQADFDKSLPIEVVSTGFPFWIVPLVGRSALARVHIDVQALTAFTAGTGTRNILVFGREGYEPGQDLSVRVFAPLYGIPEDPATGAGNGALAAYLLQQKVFGSNSLELGSGQGYEMGRPSSLWLRANRTATGSEVFVGGGVVSVAEGFWAASN